MAASDFLTIMWVVSARVTRSAVGVGISPQTPCPVLSESFTPTDCETLIRRMLVVDPAKRITIAQIRQHRWMQADPTLLQQDDPAFSMQGYTSNLGDYNEQVLGIMQALGIDRQRTVEVSMQGPHILGCWWDRVSPAKRALPCGVKNGGAV